jgi:hypothetical protein
MNPQMSSYCEGVRIMTRPAAASPCAGSTPRLLATVARGQARPVSVLAGFPGSGTITLLTRMRKELHGHRIAVIGNEFGEAEPRAAPSGSPCLRSVARRSPRHPVVQPAAVLPCADRRLLVLRAQDGLPPGPGERPLA